MLLSIAVHGAAIVAVLGVGAYVERDERPLPARLQMSSREAVVVASTPAVARPPVVAEAPVDEPPLLDVEVADAEARDEPEATPERALQPTAAQRDTRVASFARQRVRPVPVEAVAEDSPPVEKQPAEKEPPEEQPAEPPSEPAAEPAPAAPVAPVAAPFVAAERVDARPPVYPARERRLGREGVVVLLVAIAADGRVTGVELVRASRWSALDQAALRAARDWRFEPAREGDVPVASELEVEVAFELRS